MNLRQLRVRLARVSVSAAATIALGSAAPIAGATAPPAAAPQSGASQAASLRIVVVDGEDAVNIVQQKTAVAPVVEVRDRNSQPVAGVFVRFAITKGRATFNGARALTVTTNAAGRAAATGFTPTGAGALQVSATATFQGQTIAATIAQTNVMTAAEAATASTAGSSGAGADGASSAAGGGAGGAGGGLSATTLAIVGGAVAGGAIAAKEVLGGSPGGTTYSGAFSGPFTEFWQGSGCTISDAAQGTIDITLELASDGTVTRGEARINATLSRVTLGSGCQNFTLEGGARFVDDSTSVSGTASGLRFSQQHSNPVQSAVHTATLSFAGALSDGQITGTVTLTDQTSGTTVFGSGTATYPIVLR